MARADHGIQSPKIVAAMQAGNAAQAQNLARAKLASPWLMIAGVAVVLWLIHRSRK